MSLIFAHGVFERWRRDKEEGEHYKSQGNCHLRPYRFKQFCIIFLKTERSNSGNKGDLHINEGHGEVFPGWLLFCLQTTFKSDLTSRSFSSFYNVILNQEELEFVDDLRALYDKKLISNEAKVCENQSKLR